MALSLLAIAPLLVAPWSRIGQWYRFVDQFEGMGINAQGYREYRHRTTGIVMILVPSGTFWMGSSEEEIAYVKKEIQREKNEWERKHSLGLSDAADTFEEWAGGVVRRIKTDQKCHLVSVDSFLLSNYELSQAQWNSVMVDQSMIESGKSVGGDLPVSNVTWLECQRFCAKTHLSLPTEAQWEYAARGGKQNAVCYGASLPGIDDYLAKGRNSILRVVSDDAFGPNRFGFYNIYDNLAEFCLDSYDREFYESIESIRKNPLCRNDGDMIVVRGGCLFWSPRSWRAGERNSVSKSISALNYGIRPAFCDIPF
jgi:formylglycine-generating enzyme required for sulfatase activity